MKLRMDMVHDNPGEPRCVTAFRDPEKLKAYGYNTQVFKHYNTIVQFSAMQEDFFPSAQAKRWLQQMTETAEQEIFSAKAAGLSVMGHIDLFVLPEAMVQKYADQLCDSTGRISLSKEMTRQVHRLLFEELFRRYPLDGLIVRVGETYLHDTPFHRGNGAVAYGDPAAEQAEFIRLIQFLRQEICVKHGKYLIFRTWDCFPDRFHADLSYYLSVTNEIPTHEKLIFSIKHTALDFWRNVRFNPCLGQGKHPQVVEVQCQREYEGKGAYPMYVMDGVINGFPENREPRGLRDIIGNPLICGLYSWSRGGGWEGPYIRSEFWCDLNTYVISRYMQDPGKTEVQLFREYAGHVMGLAPEDCRRFHDLCLLSADAVLHGRYISAYDRSLAERQMPCCNWVRDDRIGGLRQLEPALQYLEARGLTREALAEKELSLAQWDRVKAIANEIRWPDPELEDMIQTSIDYGICLHRILALSFRLCVLCRRRENAASVLRQYDRAWEDFRQLSTRKYAASLYRESYRFSENGQGIQETVQYCRDHLCRPAPETELPL